jgi:catechol 2,3-dioxygenase-like lactoylglutathione lyase family enzyme
MLSVADLKRTMAFYCAGLGFRCVSTFGEPDPVWCHLAHGDVDLMFNRPNPGELDAVTARSRDFQVFYFYPEDVAALHVNLLAKGMAVTDLRVTNYGMREFEFRDPDGNWLWFGEPTSDPATARE